MGTSKRMLQSPSIPTSRAGVLVMQAVQQDNETHPTRGFHGEIR